MTAVHGILRLTLMLHAAHLLVPHAPTHILTSPMMSRVIRRLQDFLLVAGFKAHSRAQSASESDGQSR